MGRRNSILRQHTILPRLCRLGNLHRSKKLTHLRLNYEINFTALINLEPKLAYAMRSVHIKLEPLGGYYPEEPHLEVYETTKVGHIHVDDQQHNKSRRTTGVLLCSTHTQTNKGNIMGSNRTVTVHWYEKNIVLDHLNQDIMVETRKLGLTPNLCVVKYSDGRQECYRVTWKDEETIEDVVKCTRYDHSTLGHLGYMQPITEEEYEQKVRRLFPSI